MLAIPIARLVTRRLPQEVFLGSFSLADCYSTAFLGVGLYYIAGWVGTAVNWTHYLLKTAGTTPMPLAEKLNLYEVLQSFIPFVAGIVLLVKGRSWAMKLAARHAKAAASQPS
jgi:hypothetical protein